MIISALLLPSNSGMSQFQSGPGRITDRNTDPVKWNKAWDEYLERQFQPRSKYPDVALMFKDHNNPLVGQSFLAALEEIRKELCRLQYDLAKFTLEKRTAHNFDAIWLKMPSEARESYILQGLVVSCKAAADMEDRRLWCPESTMNFLQQDNGRGFLNLLTTICNPNYSCAQPRENPILISHPVYDALMGVGKPCRPGENEAARTGMQNYAIIIRNTFITFMLWNTMLQIYGKSITYRTAKVPRNKGSIWTLTDDPSNFNISKRKLVEVHKAFKEDQKYAEWDCSSCSTPESRLPDGRKLMECSRCKIVGRKVKYCNRDCQTNDWKRGNPPHKTICGKPLTIPGAVKTTKVQQAPNPPAEMLASVSVGQAPPDPSYPRSDVPLPHISLLQRDHKVAHVPMELYPWVDLDTGIEIPVLNSMFEICNKAMKDGDPQSFAMMCTFLSDCAMQFGIPPAPALVRLGREYQIDVDALTKLIMEREESDQDSNSLPAVEGDSDEAEG